MELPQQVARLALSYYTEPSMVEIHYAIIQHVIDEHNNETLQIEGCLSVEEIFELLRKHLIANPDKFKGNPHTNGKVKS